MTRFPRGALSATSTFRARFKHGRLGALRGGAAAARGRAAAAAGRGGGEGTGGGGGGGEAQRGRRAAPRGPLGLRPCSFFYFPSRQRTPLSSRGSKAPRTIFLLMAI